MLQKTIWIKLLIFGINILLILFLIFSCGETLDDGSITTHFVYKNLTSENVELNLFNNQNENYKNYSILANEEITISSVFYGPKTGVGEPFASAQTIVLKFSASNKCIENYFKLKNVRLYDNFSESMYNSSINILIYNVDNEEYQQAQDCN